MVPAQPQPPVGDKRIPTSARVAAVAAVGTASASAKDPPAATKGKLANAMPIPTGQASPKIAKAVPISRPTNQSVVILINSTLMSTPPAPLMRRPASNSA